MGNLRDQLKKAKLLSEKDARRVAHEERVRHKQIGGAKASDQERAAHQAGLAKQREQQAELDRQRELAQQVGRAAAAECLACEELLRREVRVPSRRGASRYHFCLANGQLPHLDLGIPDRLQLQAGETCIVRKGPPGTHDYGLMAAEHGRRIAALFPERVTFPTA